MSDGLGRFKPYPKYKDSGVEWLGKIPKHWEVQRLKRICRLSYGESLPSGSRYDGSCQVFGSNGAVGLHDRSNTLGPCLVIGRKGSFGKVNYSADSVYAIDTTFFIDASNTRADLRWLYYLLSWLRLDSLSKDSAIPGLDREDAYASLAPVCATEEQRAIASFLDRETAKIDALIAKKERLIELLQEKRSTLITHAVTKGLDQSTPMKHSDIEWLERIPAHWEIKRLQDITESLQTGPFGSQLHAEEYIEGGRPVVNPANMQNGVIVPDNACTVDRKTIDRLQRHALEIGDIVVARRGQLGRCALTTDGEAGWLCGTGSLRVRLKTDIADPKFVLHAISTSGVRDWLELYSVGSTMQNLNTRIIGRIPLAMPSAPEQRTISKFLNFELSKQASSVERIETGVKTLIELRAALVSAAVTGNIDVREQYY